MWAEQPMIDFKWEFSKRVLIKNPNEIDDVRHLGVTRGGTQICQLDVMVSVMGGEGQSSARSADLGAVKLSVVAQETSGPGHVIPM